MLSKLAPSTPIRHYNCNQSVKVAAASPRSSTCFSPTSTAGGIEEEMTKADRSTNTMSKTVEGQVSFRTAARRFSTHSTVVVPPSPICIKQHLPPSIPRTPSTTGSTRPKIKMGSIHIMSSTPQQQQQELPTMEPLDVDVATSTVPVTRTTASHVQRDVSFRTLAHRFATTNNIKSTLTSATTTKESLVSKTIPLKVPSPVKKHLPIIMDCEPQVHTPQRQPRRNSTGYYDPRASPSVDTSANNIEGVNRAAKSPQQSRRSSMSNGAVPLMSPVSATKFYTPLSTPVKGNQNEYFNNNKVFQKRYNAAATNIQRVYRGHVDRFEVVRTISTVRIQTIVRQYAQQRKLQKCNAAASIQKIFRGFATRLRSKVYQLEYQLHQIQQCHARELLDIQQKKEDEIKRMNKVIGQEHLKYIEEKQKLQKTIDDANQIIQYLRKENKKIRDKNATLRVAIGQLIEENDMMERQAKEYKIFAANLDQMKILDNENAVLASIVEQFEQREQQFHDAIEKRDEFIMLENKMGRLYLHQIQQMVVLVEETCIDPYLVAYVEELCVKCNLPGTGLEAAVTHDAMDISERKFDL